MWTYRQSTGELLGPGGTVVAVGYSGHEEGKNNPSLQADNGVGPIPQGLWEIGPAMQSASHGPVAMHLNPKPGTQTFDRGPFLIHGDSSEHPGGASLGCIIMPRSVRETVAASDDKLLSVIA